MKNTGTLQVTTPSDCEIVLTRVFDAPRHMVFDAFSKPELLSVGLDRTAGPWRSARSISESVAAFVSCCAVLPESKWECAASTGQHSPLPCATRRGRSATLSSNRAWSMGRPESYDRLAELLAGEA